MKTRVASLLLLLAAALILGGCPVGAGKGADAETAVRGNTQAAKYPPSFTHSTAGEGR